MREFPGEFSKLKDRRATVELSSFECEAATEFVKTFAADGYARPGAVTQNRREFAIAFAFQLLDGGKVNATKIDYLSLDDGTTVAGLVTGLGSWAALVDAITDVAIVP